MSIISRFSISDPLGANFQLPPSSTPKQIFIDLSASSVDPSSDSDLMATLSPKTDPTSTSDWWTSHSLGVAIGILVTVIVLLLIAVIVILHRQRLGSAVKRYSSVSNVSSSSHPSSSSPNVYKNPRMTSLFECDDTLSTVLTHPIYSEPFYARRLVSDEVVYATPESHDDTEAKISQGKYTHLEKD